jgi:hypothetical protein
VEAMAALSSPPGAPRSRWASDLGLSQRSASYLAAAPPTAPSTAAPAPVAGGALAWSASPAAAAAAATSADDMRDVLDRHEDEVARLRTQLREASHQLRR